jgi:hypothetical protein
MLTGGQIADCTAGELLLEQMPKTSMFHRDKGYDSDAICCQVEARGAMPTSRRKIGGGRGRMFSRLKDFRRIATRYDRNANNFSPPSASPQPAAIGCESRS